MRVVSVLRRGLLAGLAAILTIGGGSWSLLAGTALAAGLTVDKQVTTHSASGTSTTAPTFSTSQAGELLVAFVTADGPSGGGTQSYSSVTGGGLTWRLRQRSNGQSGTAEIWTAAAAAPVSNISVKATHKGSYAASINVVAFAGADLGATVGASVAGSSVSGAPSVALTTTKAGSWVWAVGNDWQNPIARTVGNGQVKVDEYLPPAGDTYWVQRQAATNAAAGTSVTLNDTAPTTDMWDMAALEIVPAVADTTPPSVPQNLTATAPSPTQVVLNWSASTDDSGAAPTYKVFRGDSATALASNVTSTTYTDATAAPNTTYSYTVQAVDGSGNTSPDSSPATVTTGAPDTTPPTVGLTAPTSGATVSGQIMVSASASDDVAVASVQFKLTNLATSTTTNLGSPVTTSPYQTNWNTSTVANGQYSLSAVATDTSGNTAAATAVNVTVANTAPVVPTLDPSSPAAIGIPGSTCSSPVTSVNSPSFSAPAGSRIYVVTAADSYPTGVPNCLNETTQNSISSISSASGLTWSRVAYTTQRNSYVGGFVDVWSASVPTDQTNTTLSVNFVAPMKAEPGQVSPSGMLQVIVVDNAGPNQTISPVTVDQMNSMTPTASATISNVPANSLAFMAVDYWNSYSTPPSTASGQSVIGNINNQGETDTWTTSATTSPTTTGPSTVTLSQTITDPSHPTDNWHAVAWIVTP